MTHKEYAEIAKIYKRKVAGSFMLVDGAKLTDKLVGEDFCVTRKLDGAMQILFYEAGQVCAVSTNGRIRTDLPCITEFAEAVKKYGIKTITVAAELYAELRKDVRERVADVTKAEVDNSLRGKLKLGVFDILDIDGSPYEVEHYKGTLEKIKSIFSGILVHAVEGKAASSKQEVESIYRQWVIENGAEGLVVHSEFPIVYKVKPRHTVEAAIIGYTTGEDDKSDSVREILVAVMREDGVFQQFATTGNGFSDEERVSLLNILSGMRVDSSYIETDSRNVAFQMVRPEVIAELSAIDFVSENSTGEAKMNVLLSYDSEKGYSSVGKTPGVAAHSLMFVHIRSDKTVSPSDIRISQLTDLCPFSAEKAISMMSLPKSELLTRHVYKKGEGEKLMIQKFVVWKTNKEENPLFPAYVLHYTDFSIGRKEQLKRDIRVSNNKEQILRFLDTFIVENIKKGWEEIV